MWTARVATALALLVVAVGCAAADDESVPVEFDQQLSDELVAMAEDDQQGSGSLTQRQDRLAEIFDEHGWPGHDLVGEDGSTAAWVIAQHADLDQELQERALDLLTEAVKHDDASPGDLAYLTDRVAVAKGEPQTFGTQIRCAGKQPVFPTPIADRGDVEERRADAGLDPLEDYLAEMTRLCRRADAERLRPGRSQIVENAVGELNNSVRLPECGGELRVGDGLTQVLHVGLQSGEPMQRSRGLLGP